MRLRFAASPPAVRVEALRDCPLRTGLASALLGVGVGNTTSPSASANKRGTEGQFSQGPRLLNVHSVREKQ